MTLSQTAKILVIKHGALGDIIQGVDAFSSLRAAYPKAHIAVLTSPAFASLMSAMPFFDEVIIDERAPFWHLAKLRALRDLFSRDFDLVIDMQCSKRTARYHKYLAKDHYRWFGTAEGCSDPYPDFTETNNRNRMLYPVRALGGADRMADLSFLQAEKPDISGSYAVLMPGCSPAKPSKRWAGYGDLAGLLWQRGMTPVLIGTKVDQQACDAINAACPDVVNLCQKTNLAELAALCASADLCVGNDSGPVFLAAKTGAFTYMIMGPDTNPAMSAPTGPNAHYIASDDLSQLSADQVFATIYQI